MTVGKSAAYLADEKARTSVERMDVQRAGARVVRWANPSAGSTVVTKADR